MTNSQQARPMTPDENFRELYKRVAKLNDAVSALLNPAWGSEMGLIPSGHPLHQGEAPSGPAATKPTRFVSDIRAADETAGMVRATGTLREQIATAVRSVLYQDLPGDMGQHVADAVLLVLLPGARITATLARDSEATVQRVIDVTEAGPPSGMAIPGEWEGGWDAAMEAVRNALTPPASGQQVGCRWHNGDELCSGCRRCPDVCHGCDGPKYQTKEQVTMSIHSRIAKLEADARNELEQRAVQAETERDGAYRERAHLVALLAAKTDHAVIAPASDVEDPGWQIAYLRIGGEQCSWHIAPRDASLFDSIEHVTADDPRAQWDGHTTEQKYAYIAAHTADLMAECGPACSEMHTETGRCEIARNR